ncbi:MAG: chromosome segregation protein SMC [Cocleimonas sp.]
MRLDKIKIAGFKSFVDPVTIDLRSNLTGIVGPNGCGKSNTIDAVRWVMGESSAKHLRGASMDDVIFNGSSSRKPVGQAFVELLFNNTDGGLGGEYATFSEIAIKRQIARDGQSKYFLNGSRCRRRDITDIFLGTGLGPRSYAIIEQGMISRLIEAKPEELRNTIEEAAGISKYKERRRETETRIKHTRENLERLSDLREEMEKQLAHLNRQAKAAQKFKTFKATERRISAELILLRLKQVQDDIITRQAVINENATTHQSQLAEQRSLENKIEAQREAHSDANNTFNKVQANFYQIGSEISRLEQTIQHQKQLEKRYQDDLQQISSEINTSKCHAEEDQEQLKAASLKLDELEPLLQKQQNMLSQSTTTLAENEQQLSNWQQSWNSLQQRIAEPAQQAQVERARMEQLENQTQHIASRLLKLQGEQGVFNTSANKKELTEQVKNLNITKEKHQIAKQDFETSKQFLQDTLEENRKGQAQLQEIRSRLQALTGKLSSLDVLQKADLQRNSGKSAKALNHWLQKNNLNDVPRLAESIQVESGWEQALEIVLGDLLESLQLSTYEQLEELLVNASKQSTHFSASFFINQSSNKKHSDNFKPAQNSLASKVIAPIALRPMLAHVYCAESNEEALANQPTLKAGEIIISSEGVLLGNNWLKKQASDPSNAKDGVLARQKEIDATQTEIKTLKLDLENLENSLESGQDNLKTQQDKQTEQQSLLNNLHREESQSQAVIHASENRIKQIESNQQRVLLEITELETRHTIEQEAHQSATVLRNNALNSLETLEEEKKGLAGKDAPLQQNVNENRIISQQHQAKLQETQIQVQTLKTTQQSVQQQISRFEERLQHLHERKQKLITDNSQESNTHTEGNLDKKLSEELEKRKNIENDLAKSRESLSSIDNLVRELEQKRHQAETEVEKYRSLLETLKLDWQEVSVREETLREQFAETDFESDALKQEMESDISLSSHQKSLEDVQTKVARLGAINLAAIDEFKTQSERKVYLDQQNADLVEALETLESAIAKIDKDTRSRFKETFEKVNSRIQDMFPQLFGGGKAHLELTGDDLLTTGISIMAQPPGKRISSIHLMSGGEKALTAVALVIAIFELNPAPFCMLDEVDAPLDEANVGRFCELVRKMSDRVQFIFITHSKTTMELADNLVGVTMREPGVSRLVSVDVNEAAQIVQE